MCGIAGIFSMRGEPVPGLAGSLTLMNEIQAHRGPDGYGVWTREGDRLGFGHRRLSIIGLDTGAQPMHDEGGNVITFNGEIYNYIELRRELGEGNFRTDSDTEVILQAWQAWGPSCVERFRGMFAFALWDEQSGELFLARDRFGIKPLYHAAVKGRLLFASEAKALLPFLPGIATDPEGFKDYLTFQFCLEGKTLFRDVRELPPGHVMRVRNGDVSVCAYWAERYELDFDHTDMYFERSLHERFEDALRLHVRADVPIGAYVSGGVDSSSVATLASRLAHGEFMGFCGRFAEGPEYDESDHAKAVAREAGFVLHLRDIDAAQFVENLPRVIRHLDYPVAGPGSFSQYMVSEMAARHRKVVLSGLGGDEIFGGYVRYLMAYFEQCIKGAIDGTMHAGNFVVTYESIIPNLVALRNYTPLLKHFWAEGLFDDLDKRYFRLVNRAPDMRHEIDWDSLENYSSYQTFRRVFYGDGVSRTSYFDLMTRFDCRTLLPALLHVEDRVSMAHGLESRVPLLDHPVIELAATMPSSVKFADGDLKHILKRVAAPYLPEQVRRRTDKMGFPTPVGEWIKGPAREFVLDAFATGQARKRTFIDYGAAMRNLGKEGKYGRKFWGLLSLELWHQVFHDQAADYTARARSAGWEA